MFIKLFYFLVFTSLGVTILKYRKKVFEWTGQWYWAEKYLGRGGTIVAITLIGMGMVFFWVAYPLGAFDNLKGKGVMGSGSGQVTTTEDIVGKKNSDVSR